MSASHRHICGASLLTTMIAHKGDNIVVASHFVDMSGAFSLASYQVQCVLTDIKGKEVYKIGNEQIVRGEKNCVACVISSSATRKLNKGVYFISFELWIDNERILSNEVEQVDIV